MPLQKVVAIRDESSHWYVIPAHLKNEFHDMLEKCIDDSQEDQYEWQATFSDKFSAYQTGGDLNNIQLYADI